MLLAERAIAEEQMDAPDLPPDEYRAVLAGLAQVNMITMAARPTIGFLDRVTAGHQRFRLLDVGFGHGDMLRRIARWAKRRGIVAELVGIDCNPNSAAIANAATDPALGIDFRTGDYRALGGEGFDLVVSSLVAHHMSREELVAFLRFMESEARLGWFVNDLHRHLFAYLGFPLLARVMGWHRIVREDGQLSIARAYRPREWQALLEEAGIAGAVVVRRFPFRLCVEHAC